MKIEDAKEFLEETEKKKQNNCLEKVNKILEEDGYALIANSPKITGQPFWNGEAFVLKFEKSVVEMVKVQKQT